MVDQRGDGEQDPQQARQEHQSSGDHSIAQVPHDHQDGADGKEDDVDEGLSFTPTTLIRHSQERCAVVGETADLQESNP